MRPTRLLRATLALSLACSSPALAGWPDDPTVNFPVSVAPGDQFWPRSVSDGAGGIICAWLDQRFGLAEIYAQRVSVGGAAVWPANGVALSAGSAWPVPPAIASDGAGGAIVAWATYPADSGVDLRAQRVDAAGTPLWGPGGVPVCALGGSQSSPSIASDGAGGAIVVWSDSRAGAAGYYAQRLSPAGLALWGANGERVLNAASSASVVIAADGASGVVFALPLYTGGAQAVVAQRVDAAGAPMWGAGGTIVWPSAGYQNHPALAADGAGGAWLAWIEFEVGPGVRVRGERLDAAGARMWTSPTTIAPAGSSSSSDTLAILPAAGSAIVAWTDLRSGSVGIRAQRLDGTGVPQWAASGVPVNSTVSTQFGLALAADGAEGALLCWTDSRNSAFDVYAQRLDSYGLAQWGPLGIAVSLATGYKWAPAVVGDGYGGAVMAWQDSRAGTNSDLYAQRVHGTGTLDVPLAAGDALPLSAAPSPARAGQGATIRFALAGAANARIAVFDVAGREVRVLASGVRPAGEQAVRWDARDAAGRAAPPGLYFIRLAAAGRAACARLVLVR